MLATERHALILDQVATKNTVSIRYLSDELGVSRETVRNDIKTLSEQHMLTQVRGGAVRVQTAEPPLDVRSDTNPEGKNAIADFVVSQIPDGASIIIDSGSTTQVCARALAKHRKDLVVYTNDLDVARILARTSKELVILGGRLADGELASQGLDTIKALTRYRAEFALVSVGGVSEQAGFTDFTSEAATLRDTMLEHAHTPFLLVDHTKFGIVGQVCLSTIPLATTVVVDRNIPAEITNILGVAKANLHICDTHAFQTSI